MKINNQRFFPNHKKILVYSLDLFLIQDPETRNNDKYKNLLIHPFKRIILDLRQDSLP